MNKILTFLFIFAVSFMIFTPTSHAAIKWTTTLEDLPAYLQTLPAAPEGVVDVKYIVYKSNQIYKVNMYYSYNTSFYLSLTYDQSNNEIWQYSTFTDGSVYRVLYNDTGESWGEPSSANQVYNDTGTVLNNKINSVYYSTVDIKNRSDLTDVVFPAPPEAPAELYQIIQEVTTGEMAKTQNNLVGVMRTLTLCGVGLMALLMVLLIFGKVFRIFRVG